MNAENPSPVAARRFIYYVRGRPGLGPDPTRCEVGVQRRVRWAGSIYYFPGLLGPSMELARDTAWS